MKCDNCGAEMEVVLCSDCGAGNMMQCPKGAVCNRDEDGCNAHCEPHPHGDGCDYGADGCPPCVPSSANAEHQILSEAK